MVYNSYILLIATFYLTKTENRTKKSLTKTENNSKKSLTPLSHYCFEYCTIFAKKMQIFYEKSDDLSKIKKVLVEKGIFSESAKVCTYVPNVKFLA